MTFTAEAQAAWDAISEAEHERALAGGFCARCLATRQFTLEQGEMRGDRLAVIGPCVVCGGRVVRLIEAGSAH